MGKIFKFLLLCFCFSNVSFAQVDGVQCDQVQRAVATDQQDLILAPVFGYFQLQMSDLLSMELSEYVSWKDGQQGCLANVVHYAEGVTKYYDASNDQVCRVNFTVHAKDHFVGVVDYEREYKIRNVTRTCSNESQQLARIQSCQASGLECAEDGDVLDLLGDCKCKSIYEIIQYVDQGDKYRNFFNPQNAFAKPESVQSPFPLESVGE